jgi:hypothetical protein
MANRTELIDVTSPTRRDRPGRLDVVAAGIDGWLRERVTRDRSRSLIQGDPIAPHREMLEVADAFKDAAVTFDHSG